MPAADSLDDELLRRLPLPLAQLYLRTLNAKNALDRHNAAFHLWEASLKLLGSVAIVDYAEGDAHSAAASERLQALARPSTGHWWEFVRTLVPILAKRDARFAAIDELLLGPKRDDLPRVAGLDAVLCEFLAGTRRARATVSLRELFDHLVAYRNRAIGHGPAGLLSTAHYEKLGGSLLAGLAELLGRLDVLAGRKLVYVEDVRRQPAGDWIVERYALVGETPRRLESRRVAEQATTSLPRPQRVYLQPAGGSSAEFADRQGDGRFTSLYPLVHFDFDSGAFYFLSARGRKKGAGAGAGAEYFSYVPGGVLVRDDLAGEQRALLARILGTAVDDAALTAWAEKSRAAEPAEPAGEAAAPKQIGEFELLSFIDEGGMGTVYRAWQPLLQRQVALKCMRASGDPKAEARFRREIRALGRVEHPHLIKIFASGSEGNQWYYAMELVEGADLGRVCDLLAKSTASEVGLAEWDGALSTACQQARSREKPLSAERALGPADAAGAPPTAEPADRRGSKGHVSRVADLVRQAAEATHALHEAKVIHRDIKPSNVLVTPDGKNAVLMDLGLAQLADAAEGRLTRSRQFVGTLRYASPEQVLGAGDLDRRTDVYSLGATLWELLTLRPLFGAGEGTPTPELMRKIQHTDPEPVRKYNRNVPEDLELIVRKCLEKDENRRYQTAQELAADLARWLDGDAVLAKPPSLGYLFGKFARRNRVPLAAAAGALVLLCGGVAVSFWQIQRALEREQGAHAQAAGALTGEKKAHEESQSHRKRAEEALAALRHRLRELAVSYLNQGSEAHAAGDRRAGLHWHLSAYQVLVDAKTPPGDPLRYAARHLLGGWGGHCRTLPCDELVKSVAYSPDGQTFLTRAVDGSVQLWNAASGQPIGTPLGKTIFNHRGVQYSPEGKTMAISTDNEVNLWEAATGKRNAVSIVCPGSIDVFCFSPDSKLILTACRTEPEEAFASSPDSKVALRLWEVATGKPIDSRFPLLQHVSIVLFNPQGKTFLVGGANELSQWDLATGKAIGAPLNHGNTIDAVAYSPDGTMILTGSQDKTARLWDASTGKPLGPSLPFSDGVSKVAFRPDGKAVLIGSGEMAQLWSPATGEPMADSLPRRGRLSGLCFRPDGRVALTMTTQDPQGNEVSYFPDLPSLGGEIRLWDTATGASDGPAFHYEGGDIAAAYGPDGKTVLMGGEGGPLQLWDSATVEVSRATLDGKVDAWNWGLGVFSPDAKFLFTPNPEGPHELWDAERIKPLGTSFADLGLIGKVAFSRDGRKLFTAGEKTARLWDTATGKAIGPLWQDTFVGAVALSADGKTLAEGGENSIWLWDAETGMPLGPPLAQKEPVTAIVFSADGTKVLTGSEEGTVRLWDVRSGKPIGDPVRHAGSVEAIALSPDGGTLVAATGATAQLWDARAASPIGSPLKHGGRVQVVALSPDGRTLLTGSADQTARLWDTTTAKPIGAPLEHHGPVGAAAWSSDGKTVKTFSKGIVRTWTVPGALPDEPERIQLWVETTTGFRRDAELRLRPLQGAELSARDVRLSALGGAPVTPVGPLSWHRYQAAESEEAGDWFAAAFHLKYVVEAEPHVAEYRNRRGLALAKLEKWSEAVAELRQAEALAPSSEVLHALATAELAVGNEAAFREDCQKLLRTLAAPQHAEEWDGLVWLAVQSPAGALDWEPYVSLAIQTAGESPNDLSLRESLGAAMFRAGHFANAKIELERAMTRQPTPSWSTCLFLAMTYSKLHDEAKAAERLGRAENYFTALRSKGWMERLRYRLLADEAKRVVDEAKRSPAKDVKTSPGPKPPAGTARHDH